jgi:hypothetical protein
MLSFLFFEWVQNKGAVEVDRDEFEFDGKVRSFVSSTVPGCSDFVPVFFITFASKDFVIRFRH